MPADLIPLYDAAAKTCDNFYITGAVLAAQGKQESMNFDPAVINGARRSPAGAEGVAQFMPGSWKKEWGNPFDPKDAIKAQGDKMCALTHDSRVLKTKKAINGSTLQLALAGYNAGTGALHPSMYADKGSQVGEYIGFPPFKQSTDYVHNILDWSGLYDGMDPELAARVKAMIEESHYNLWLRYGYRTYDEQKQLWTEELAKQHGDAAKAAIYVANPDVKRSHHLDGLAADVNGDYASLQALAPNHELCFPYSWERWHVEKCAA